MSYRSYTKTDLIIGLCIFGLFGLKYLIDNLDKLLYLVIFVILCVIFYYAFNSFFNKIQTKYCIYNVDSKLRLEENKIGNNYCNVLFEIGNSIIVTESNCINYARTYQNTSNSAKRMFTVSYSQTNINHLWKLICKYFSQSTTFDELYQFSSSFADIVIVEIKTAPQKRTNNKTQNTQNSNIQDVKPDNYKNTYVQQTSNESSFTKMEDINSANTAATIGINEINDNLLELSDSPCKIDINLATDSQLATLPGINIILAKKIIEHRNLNGYFKTIDEFLNVANLKPHFVQKVKNSIIIKSIKPNNDLDNNERIIDF